MFHVHLTYFESPDRSKSISFRDFLRTHPKLAQEYSQIKLKAILEAKKFRKKKDKKEAYMNTKKPVIEKILKLMTGKNQN
jgi:GrpB-like predicted nucleotidyltransferase (UPF0157 family)